MSWWSWALLGAGISVAAYAVFVVWLLLVGRRDDARALAGFIPDCVILIRRLLGDARVARGRKLVLVALIAYLLLPFDLVPDFVPIAGQLDDAIVVALALRIVLHAGGADLLREHWPGPPASLRAITRVAFRSGELPDR